MLPSRHHATRGRAAGTGKDPDPADVYRAARIFACLAHPARIRLICALAGGRSATQKELLAEFGWPQSTVARHIGALRDRGLLHAVREDGHTRLTLDGTVTPQLLSVLCQWVHPETREQFLSKFTRGTEAGR